MGSPAGTILEYFREGKDSSSPVVSLGFSNLQNGLMAFVQQTVGHLGYPFALRSPPPSTNPGDPIGSNIFDRVALKNQAGSSLWSGPTNNRIAPSDRHLALGTRRTSSGRAAHRGRIEKPIIVDGRQRINCNVAINTRYRKQADRDFIKPATRLRLGACHGQHHIQSRL